MLYKAKLSGEITDPKNSMSTLKFEVAAESYDLENVINSVWVLRNKIESESKAEKTEIMFIGEFKDEKNTNIG